MGFLDFFSKPFKKITSAIKSLGTKSLNFVRSGWSTLKRGGARIIQGVGEIFKKIKHSVTDVASTIATPIKAVASRISGVVQTVYTDIRGVVKTAASSVQKVATGAEALGEGLGHGAQELSEGVASALPAFAQSLPILAIVAGGVAFTMM